MEQATASVLSNEDAVGLFPFGTFRCVGYCKYHQLSFLEKIENKNLFEHYHKLLIWLKESSRKLINLKQPIISLVRRKFYE